MEPHVLGGGGSLANHGTGEHDKRGMQVGTAPGALLVEAEHEIGSSYEATV